MPKRVVVIGEIAEAVWRTARILRDEFHFEVNTIITRELPATAPEGDLVILLGNFFYKLAESLWSEDTNFCGLASEPNDASIRHAGEVNR